MSFTSYKYVLFLIFSLLIYWVIPEKYRKYLLLGLSWIFYCSWKPEHLLILLLLTIFNYYFPYLYRKQKGSSFLVLGIIINLMPLLYFKYLSFIFSNMNFFLQKFGYNIAPVHTMLPIGISFYTFQMLCYQIEVYGGEAPFRRITDFALYNAFFPKVVAGPIVRPDQFREMLAGERTFKGAHFGEGTHRIIQGLFKKIVIADNLNIILELVFLPGRNLYAPADVIFGAIGFGLQLYFDFSAYSDIAIGSAQMFGYKLPENFNYPYGATSFSDFWTKWHITLSSWIRDYVYMPFAIALGGKRYRLYVLTLVSMVVMGFWHGANWTFALWGIWHGVLLIIQNTIAKDLFLRPVGIRKVVCVVFTYIAVNIGWLFFKADSISQVAIMLKSLFTLEQGIGPIVLHGRGILFIMTLMIGLFLWTCYIPKYIQYIRCSPSYQKQIRFLKPVYYTILIFTIVLMEQTTSNFIYVKF